MYKLLCASFGIFVLFSLFSCKKDNTIRFDESHPLALAPDIEWAVVTAPYAAYRKLPDWEAETGGRCRKADILQVRERALSPDGERWYGFDEGWLSASTVSVYRNRFKAKTAAAAL